ncbi:MAG: bacillithiol biosynthesis deacetylase BshB1 [candidate division Zixibacteria bacterium]|nr:bacillithiol biosynthesis deacetylase BshB1 [candidate division Zixibacteria bacterium]
MKLDVLAIAAHPDDVEITCGGTMIKLADLGKSTGVLDLTEGEMGTLGTPAERLEDAADAAKILNLAMRENLHLPDAALEPNRDNRLKIAKVIRDYQPDLVILPYRDCQRHPDHRITSILGYDACFLAGLKKAALDGKPFRPRKIIYATSFIDATHTFFVDVSEQFERKHKAVAAFRSQFDGSAQSRQIFKPGNDIFELMNTYCRKYGIDVGCIYAEAFYTIEPMLVDDPTDLKVRSI